MAHVNQIRWCFEIRNKFPEMFEGKQVLDVGSLDINGNNRYLFISCNYTGLDIGHGNNVDIICPIEDYVTDKKYDTIISTEMLEHCRNWDKALLKMYDLLVDGGLLLITAGGDGRYPHGITGYQPEGSPYTNDYYGNISNEMISSILTPSMFVECFYRQHIGNDMQFYGIKK